jgi:hypothetical protein
VCVFDIFVYEYGTAGQGLIATAAAAADAAGSQVPLQWQALVGPHAALRFKSFGKRVNTP